MSTPRLPEPSGKDVAAHAGRHAKRGWWPPSRRLLTGAGTFVLLLVALAVVLSTVPGVAGRARALVFGPAPTPTLALTPGADEFYIAPGPTWATVSMDGHPLAHLPAYGTDPPLRPARGYHSFIWHAPPFRDLQCSLTIPLVAPTGDTCLYDKVVVLGPTGVAAPLGHTVWLLQFFPELGFLTQAQQADFVNVANAALAPLASTSTVHPGERYVTASGTVRATQPVRATLSLTLDTDAYGTPHCQYSAVFNFCSYFGQLCAELCSVPEYGHTAAGGTPRWTVMGAVREVWRFTTPDGRDISGPPLIDGGPTDAPVMFSVSWDGTAWHVAASVTSPKYAFRFVSSSALYLPTALPDFVPTFHPAGCWSLSNMVTNTEIFDLPTDARYKQPPWNFAPGSSPAAGCAAVTAPTAAGSSAPPAYVMDRFGVLLAANSQAQRIWPKLPLASPQEQRLAAQWIAQAPPAGGG